MAWLSQHQIENMGFAEFGENVRLSDKASYYNCSRISFGSHVRVDDFCVLSSGEGGIVIGNYVHIAVYSSLIGRERITLSDFCNISSRVALYSSSDDYTGTSLTNPTVPAKFRKTTDAPVLLEKHVIIGCGSVVLPGVRLEEGVAIGALSLVNKGCGAYGIYGGVPAKRIRERSRELLALEQQFRAELA
jgi:dTDP-4-amino-4,6-dideoxy-D-glucose acyltransferase